MVLYFVLGCFINAFFYFIFGLIVLVKDVKRKVNVFCAIMAFSFALWVLGLGLMVSAKDVNMATFYLKYIHYFATVFIPILLLHFTIIF